jgi:hypothetical protein
MLLELRACYEPEINSEAWRYCFSSHFAYYCHIIHPRSQLNLPGKPSNRWAAGSFLLQPLSLQGMRVHLLFGAINFDE